VNLSELPWLTHLVSYLRSGQSRRADSAILRAVRDRGPITVAEVSVHAGLKMAETQLRLDALMEHGIVHCSNGHWYLANPPAVRRFRDRW
jgi:predicted Rossmann fold nucleotide-binding protein DprA/Smf involved in DNA uptake